MSRCLQRRSVRERERNRSRQGCQVGSGNAAVQGCQVACTFRHNMNIKRKIKKGKLQSINERKVFFILFIEFNKERVMF